MVANALHSLPGLPPLGGCEHECELQETPGPDGEDHDAEDLVGVDALVLERVEELDDVGGRADVDQQQLRQLVPAGRKKEQDQNV